MEICKTHNMPSILKKAVDIYNEKKGLKQQKAKLQLSIDNFINNPDEIRKKLYPHQRQVWDYLVNGGKRAALVWHRRSGKDITALHWVTYAALQRVGSYWYILPTAKVAKRNMWEGKTIEGKRYLDVIPEQFVDKINNTNMAVYLKNGSIIQFMTAESFDTNIRGGNPLGVVLSEFSYMSPNLLPALTPIMSPKGHEGWLLFVYTPCGKNHAWNLFNRKDEGWFKQILTVNDTTNFIGDRIVTESTIEDERQIQDEEMIQREYFCSFDVGLKGTYYLHEMQALEDNHRFSPFVYDRIDSRLSKVYTAWDLGINDPTIIWFFVKIDHYYYFIDYYENTGKDVEFYLDVLLEKQRQHGYIYGGHILPHDASRRDITGRTRYVILSEGARRMRLGTMLMGLYFAVNDGINLVKKFLYRCFIDQDKCASGILALRQYRQHEMSKQDTYIDRPEHDWSSHASDAFRYAITYVANVNITKQENDNQYEQEFYL